MNDLPSRGIFISWSQGLAQQLATPVKSWLGKCFPDAAIFVSKDDIDLGTVGIAQIHTALAASQVGVVLVTRENQERQWINFEIGVLFAHLQRDSGRVIPLLIDLEGSDLTGPMKDLQYAELTKQSIEKIVASLCNALDLSASLENRTANATAFWPELEESMNRAKSAVRSGGLKKPPKRTEREMIEEILDAVRQIRMEIQSPSKAPSRRLSDRPARISFADMSPERRQELSERIASLIERGASSSTITRALRDEGVDPDSWEYFIRRHGLTFDHLPPSVPAPPSPTAQEHA